MRERPIIFSAPMVRAILDGRKTQTRRVVKLNVAGRVQQGGVQWHPEDPNAKYGCPYGQRSDRLWVRETWADVNLEGAPAIAYRADGDFLDLMEDPSFLDNGAFNYDDPRYLRLESGKSGNRFAVWAHDLIAGVEGRWRAGIHMPRWTSRITLEVTGVRVERLRSICDADCFAEGLEKMERRDANTHPTGEFRALNHWIGKGAPPEWDWPRSAFGCLWESINGGGSWHANPLVWVIEFRRLP